MRAIADGRAVCSVFHTAKRRRVFEMNTLDLTFMLKCRTSSVFSLFFFLLPAHLQAMPHCDIQEQPKKTNSEEKL